MIALQEEKTPIDITTVTSYLKKKNELTEVGGVEYLNEVLDFVPTASNIDYYIKNVEDAALLRGLIETAEEIAKSLSKAKANRKTKEKIFSKLKKWLLN